MITKIISNKIKCVQCGDIIESRTVHEFKTCSCGRVSVDGGREYMRRCYKEKGDYEDLSEYETTDICGITDSPCCYCQPVCRSRK